MSAPAAPPPLAATPAVVARLRAWECGSTAGALIDKDLHRIGGVLRVYRRAAQVFGSRKTAERWLCSVQPALRGHTPLQLAWTERGEAAVERLLTRIVRGEG